MKICIFAYNFEHKKTQEGIIKLITSNFKIDEVIAMNKKKIISPIKTIEIVPRDINFLNPRIICTKLNIPYKVIDHNSKNCEKYLKKKKFDIGIILGARILKEEIINCFKIGILNLHPGILPENRGLDTYQWAILNKIPQGATAHLIDRKMDKGKILYKKNINIYKQDTLKDFYLRVQSLELDLMIKSLKALKKNINFGYFPKKQGKYHSYISNKEEKEIIKNFDKYKKKFIS